MQKRKFFLITAIGMGIAASTILIAADHIDAPAVTGQSTDVTDLYVFNGQDQNNLVFAANTQGLLSPAATGQAHFDDNTLIEFNIDNNGDNIEDYVIQCISKNGKMKVYGPFKPDITGTTSYLYTNKFTVQTDITEFGKPVRTGYQNGVKVFAGPRDDPFFFDLVQYQKILAGQATSFNSPGSDTFAGTNVLALVVEVPKWKFGYGDGPLNVWVESKTRTQSQNYKN